MKHERGAAPVGGAALLTVFSVLCLATFGVLSVSTVQSQVRLSRAGAESTAEYYRADAQAEEILARLRMGETVEGVIREDGVCAYVCPISAKQMLMVELSEADWTVLRWQTVSTAQWEADEHINVWQEGEVP